jgi:biotin transport system ATP-binding protein
VAGANASGKTTLLRCIKGLYKHDGDVEMDEKCFLVFQDPDTQIIGSTVEKDLGFGIEDKSRIAQVASAFGLEGLMDRKPSTLSGGEKRRLAIADAIVSGARILLLDEIFSNLDYPSIRMVIKTLKDLRDDCVTIVLVTHEIEKVLALSDYLVILDHGRIAHQGRTEELFSLVDWEAHGIRAKGKLESMLWQ